MRGTRSARTAFTLVEMMVVVAIIGILAAIVVTGAMRHAEKARINGTKEQIRQIKMSLAAYKLDTGSYPSSLSALVERAPDYKGDWPKEAYLEGFPKDGWGNDFIYTYPGSKKEFDIISYGADGKEGGEGENADITN